MGAETVVYVLVEKRVYEWVEVQAVTLVEATMIAAQLPGVQSVREASYEPGGVVT